METKNYNNEIVFQPFKYHKRLKDFFKSKSKTWNWFSQEKLKEKQIHEFKTSLLKNTYRLEAEDYTDLYSHVDEICQKLSIDASVTLYQENNSTQYNAAIVNVDKEAHIVLSGNLMDLLSPDELKALLAHELSHYLFCKIDNEEFEITQRIVLALANDSRSEDAIIETARIFQLYLELFCDTGALKVCEDYTVVISMLIKLNTGLHKVNADSYLEQAAEILKRDQEASQHHSHPESYIRSLALKLRADQDKNYYKQLEKMIIGPLNMHSLDIFQQKEMSAMTDQLIQLIVKPKWINTSSVANLLKKYFKNFSKDDENLDLEALVEQIDLAHSSIKEYCSYVLLDFAMKDSDLERLGLGHCMQIAELLNLSQEFERIIRKELKLGARDYKSLQENVIKDLEQLTEGKEDSIYND